MIFSNDLRARATLRLSLIASVVMATLLFAACADSQASRSSQKLHYLTLRGEGLVEVAPDEVTIDLHLACEKSSAQSASTCLREQVAALHTQFAELGVDSVDRQTKGLRLDKRYRWTGQQNRFDGYTASTSLTVRLRDVSDLGVVYDQLLDDESLTLGALQYGHSGLDSLKRLAHQRAYEQSTLLAKDLLHQSGQSKSTLQAVAMRNSPVSSSLPNTGAYADAVAMTGRAVEEAQSMSPSFQSSTGQIAIRAELWVDYQVN